MPGLGDLVSDSGSAAGDIASLGSLGALPILLRRFLALRRRLLLLDSSSLRTFTVPSSSPFGVEIREISAGVTGAELGTALPSELAVSFTMFVFDGMMVRRGCVREVGGEFINISYEDPAGQFDKANIGRIPTS